jgi:DNA mismatch repair protein MLH1
MQTIRRLDETVVNKIAAGEIIVLPANALKEMVENSIDAQATMITILVKDGGTKLLQISDNGTGISKSDLPLVCQRFATSKLSKFEDLQSIATYGFRGEALASISHIARVSIVSKTQDSNVGYKAYYINGELATPTFKAGDGGAVDPKPVAGTNGTQITVEDLFYNIPSRLRALRPRNEELSKILDIAGKYAIHSDNVGFICKKVEKSQPILSTSPKSQLKDRIRVVFGSPVANELLFVEKMEDPRFKLISVTGAVTSSNFDNKKKIQPIFFVNHRLVGCEPLKRALTSVFNFYLPKGNHPFIYLSLEIASENVDVNVHPTKRELRFLHEEEIIELICDKVHDTLSQVDKSRKFKTQSLVSDYKRIGYDQDSASYPKNKKPRQENKLVRVDTNQSKISKYLLPESASSTSVVEEETEVEVEEINVDVRTTRERVKVNLQSISNLRQEVSSSIHRELTNVFNNAVYVGIVDESRRLCCFQYDVKLYLCDYSAVLTEFYYQLSLSEFCNYGEFVLSEPIQLKEVLEPLYTKNKELTAKETIIEKVLTMKDMFEEYFRLTITTNDNNEPILTTLPMIMKDIEPVTSKLPYFIYRLGTQIDYDDEQLCLQGIFRQIALLYLPEPILDNEANKLDKMNHDLENVIFPELKLKFIATQSLLHDVVQIADIPGLYRVFERC